jgi:hypothetical protein
VCFAAEDIRGVMRHYQQSAQRMPLISLTQYASPPQLAPEPEQNSANGCSYVGAIDSFLTERSFLFGAHADLRNAARNGDSAVS